jgi:thymidylate synthase
MQFEPLYYSERLNLVNLTGDVGVVTLWSQVKQVRKLFEDLGVDLNPETSRVAVMANLYGNGLPQMLRNLLWNPQIKYLLLLGHDLSGSREELTSFFTQGLEVVDYLGSPAWKIIGTKRIIDGEATPDTFLQKVSIASFGTLSDPATKDGVTAYFESLPSQEECRLERQNVPIPEATVNRFPSEPRSHDILRDRPLEAWEELIFRLVRFGHRNKLKKGERIELQNVKVVVSQPVEEPESWLAQYGFSLAHFREYQQRILDPNKPEDLSYTYGNRLRGYFRHNGEVVDSLCIAVQRLRADPETRHAYIALWDNARDLPEGHSCPCFVTAFFRKFEGKLTLTATFRSHNAMDAWLENVYGLIAIQRFVAESAEMEPGPLTVISHSISIDPAHLEKAQSVAKAKKTHDVVDRETGKHELRFDPNGIFTVTVDRDTGELVAQHAFEGMVIGEYRGKSSEEVESQLARDVALSDVAHALYLGRELARKEALLKADKGK